MIDANAARFFAMVDRNGPVPAHRPELGPCHVWTAGVDSRGYGLVQWMGKSVRAHRVAFLLAHGHWPQPCGLHRCDNTSCVNEAHLFEGTKAENNADRDAKGRLVAPRGTDHGRHTKPHRTARGERDVTLRRLTRAADELEAWAP